MNEIISFLAEILQKIKPIEAKRFDNVRLKEMDSVHLEAKGEIEFSAKMGITKKNQNYVLRYEIEKI